MCCRRGYYWFLGWSGFGASVLALSFRLVAAQRDRDKEYSLVLALNLLPMVFGFAVGSFILNFLLIPKVESRYVRRRYFQPLSKCYYLAILQRRRLFQRFSGKTEERTVSRAYLICLSFARSRLAQPLVKLRDDFRIMWIVLVCEYDDSLYVSSPKQLIMPDLGIKIAQGRQRRLS